MSKAGPLEYINISEFLYVQYKKRILDNLRRRYKFSGGHHETCFDRQFLNLSTFFNSIPVRKPQRAPERVEAMDGMDEMDEEDEESPEMM